MSRWFFSYAFVDRFASQLVDQLAIATPPSSRKRKENPVPWAAISAAQRYQQREKLNFFQRARLAYQLQNRLLATGYTTRTAREAAATLSQATTLFHAVG